MSKLSSTPGNCGEVHDNQHFITYSLTLSCWKKQEASMGCGGFNQLCRNILAFVWGRGERSRPVTAMTGLSATLLTRQITPCTTPISFPALQFLDQPSYRSLFHRPSKTFCTCPLRNDQSLNLTACQANDARRRIVPLIWSCACDFKHFLPSAIPIPPSVPSE